MSHRAALEQRLERLSEISDIMTAMKTMALIETRKFAKFMAHQQQLLDSIERAAADFLHHFPSFRGGPHTQQPDLSRVLIVIGSERGFCGDFNETLVSALPQPFGRETRLILIGRRLAGKLENLPAVADSLGGPTVAEEVPVVLDQLITELDRLSRAGTPLTRLTVLAHDSHGAILLQELLPLKPVDNPETFTDGFAPLLHLDPADFFRQLNEHYLAAKLPALFYGSLMAENRRRLEHMETALNRMKTRIEDITCRRNALRQEEITEQIEVILLSADAGVSRF